MDIKQFNDAVDRIVHEEEDPDRLLPEFCVRLNCLVHPWPND